MSHVDFEGSDAQSKKALFVQEMLRRGILASNLFYATLAHTEAHVERYLKAADEAFGLVAEASGQGRLMEALQGAPSAVGFQRLT